MTRTSDELIAELTSARRRGAELAERKTEAVEPEEKSRESTIGCADQN